MIFSLSFYPNNNRYIFFGFTGELLFSTIFFLEKNKVSSLDKLEMIQCVSIKLNFYQNKI